MNGAGWRGNYYTNRSSGLYLHWNLPHWREIFPEIVIYSKEYDHGAKICTHDTADIVDVAVSRWRGSLAKRRDATHKHTAVAVLA